MYSWRLFSEHDLFRPAFARRSIKPNDEPRQGLRAGGKPVLTFRDHALTLAAIAAAWVATAPFAVAQPVTGADTPTGDVWVTQEALRPLPAQAA
jgi:hypothetical protein